MNRLSAAASVFTLLALQGTHTAAEEADPAAIDGETPLIQVFLGVLELDDQTGKWQDISDDNVDVDFSSLPSGGIEAEYSYYKGWIHWGINPGGSIAWKSDDTNFSGGFTGENGTTIRVDIDNSLFLFELHLGGYVRGRLTDRITTYAAAGPMVMYGSHEVEDGEIPEASPSNGTVVIESSDESDFGFGAYARAGIDYRIKDQQRIGLGIRYMYAELDFNRTVGKVDIEGPQYVLAYTMPF